jgi:hypothetical protein
MDGARTFRELTARFLQLEQISRAVDMVCSTGTMPIGLSSGSRRRKTIGPSNDRSAIAADRRPRRLRSGSRRAGRWTHCPGGGGVVLVHRYCISGRSASGLRLRADARRRHTSVRAKLVAGVSDASKAPMLRPTGLGSGIDKERPDYTVYSGGWDVGRSMSPVAVSTICAGSGR